MEAASSTRSSGPTRDQMPGWVRAYRVRLEAHAVGRLVRLLASQGAKKDVPASLALLKQRVEGE